MKKKLRVKNFFLKKDLETPETPKKRIKIRSTETILQNRFAPAPPHVPGGRAKNFGRAVRGHRPTARWALRLEKILKKGPSKPLNFASTSPKSSIFGKKNCQIYCHSSNEICCIYWFKIVFKIVFTGSKLGMFGHVRACPGMFGHARACPAMYNFHHTDLQESSEGHVFQHNGYIFSYPPPRYTYIHTIK